MATKTEIANDALNRIGSSEINDIDTDTSVEATTCKRHFERARKAYLRDADPGFARKEVALALVSGEEDSKYEHVYAYPADCMKAREIFNPASTTEVIEFDKGTDAAGNSKTILTDQEDAVLIYTRDITNLNVFEQDDLDVLALSLAMRIVMKIKRDEQLRNSIANEYIAVLGIAKKNSNKDKHVPLKKHRRYIDARR
jgi:hypothetical protein